MPPKSKHLPHKQNVSKKDAAKECALREFRAKYSMEYANLFVQDLVRKQVE